MSRVRKLVALFHDVEQDLDNPVDPEVCRRMLRDLLAIERRAGVRSTCHVAGRLLRDQPELARWIRGAGSEVAFHSFHHPSDWGLAHHAEEVRACREFSSEPLGYRSPRNAWSAATVEAEERYGFAWSAEGDPHDEPYFIRGALVRLPLEGDDWPLHTGRVEPDAWVRAFKRALAKRNFVAWGCHDCVAAAHPDLIPRLWEEVARLAAAPGRCAVTMTEAADLYRRSALGRPPGSSARFAGGRATFERLAGRAIGPGDRLLVAGSPPFDLGGFPGDIEWWDPFVEGDDAPPSSVSPPALLLCAGVAEFLLEPARLLEACARRSGPGVPTLVALPGPTAPAPGGGGLGNLLFRRFSRMEAEALASRLAEPRVEAAPAGRAGGPAFWILTGRSLAFTGERRRILPLAASPFHHLPPSSSRWVRLARRVFAGMRNPALRAFPIG